MQQHTLWSGFVGALAMMLKAFKALGDRIGYSEDPDHPLIDGESEGVNCPKCGADRWGYDPSVAIVGGTCRNGFYFCRVCQFREPRMVFDRERRADSAHEELKDSRRT